MSRPKPDVFGGKFEKYRYQSYTTLYDPKTFTPIRKYSDGLMLRVGSGGSMYWDFPDDSMTEYETMYDDYGNPMRYAIYTDKYGRKRRERVAIEEPKGDVDNSPKNNRMKYLLIG